MEKNRLIQVRIICDIPFPDLFTIYHARDGSCFYLLFFFSILEDCTDCFVSQKKDEPNDKEKKEEEEPSASVHHSIIETWDWGRQPGEKSGSKGNEAICCSSVLAL